MKNTERSIPVGSLDRVVTAVVDAFGVPIHADGHAVRSQRLQRATCELFLRYCQYSSSKHSAVPVSNTTCIEVLPRRISSAVGDTSDSRIESEAGGPSSATWCHLGVVAHQARRWQYNCNPGPRESYS